MRTAAIDIGTNSVKLLIADVERGRIRRILSEHVIITRLGEGLSETSRLQPTPWARTVKVLKKFMRLCRAFRVERIHCVSTKVLRQARNRDPFLASCARLGLHPRIIPGREESRLGYRGAVSGIRVRRAIVIDIGGGSTEISIGSTRRFERGTSLNIGAVALTERFLKHDPPTESELGRMHRAIRARIRGFAPRKGPLIGIGGTVTTLGLMRNSALLTARQIDAMAGALSKITSARRKKQYRLEPGRADIIVAGAMILLEVMRKLGKNTCRISTRGLRHGLILDRG